MSELALPETHLYLTPAAYDSAYADGVTVRANTEAIASIGAIIAAEFPQQALPVAASGLSVVVRGSTRDRSRRYIGNWDEFWAKAGNTQSYVPATELELADPRLARPFTKAAILHIGRPVFETTVVSWHEPQAERFVGNWLALRLTGTAGDKTKQQLGDAVRNFPIFGGDTRKRQRVMGRILAAGLEPFVISQRASYTAPTTAQQPELGAGPAGPDQQAISGSDTPGLPPRGARELPGGNDTAQKYRALGLGALLPLLQRLRTHR